MRTDVTPPEGGVPGPPIGQAGTLLMRDGKIYFIPTSGPCTLYGDFGAPRPGWLSASGGEPMSASQLEEDEDGWAVDLNHLDNGLVGCFYYTADKTSRVPRLFGGSSSCSDWPAGSYIEYSNFKQQAAPEDIFAVPESCPEDNGGNPDDSKACLTCHDQQG